MCIPIDPSTLSLGIYSTEIVTQIDKDTYVQPCLLKFFLTMKSGSIC